jgi:NADPH:quinone reductase-like Zn-dependent oxidoreductase
VIVRDQLTDQAGPLTGGAGFDVVVDPVGGLTRRTSLDVLAGRIGIDVRDQLPLADASEAHRRIGSGRSTGKLVLAVPPPQASTMHGKGLRECAR